MVRVASHKRAHTERKIASPTPPDDRLTLCFIQFLDPLLLSSEVLKETGRHVAFLTAAKASRSLVHSLVLQLTSVPFAPFLEYATCHHWYRSARHGVQWVSPLSSSCCPRH